MGLPGWGKPTDTWLSDVVALVAFDVPQEPAGCQDPVQRGTFAVVSAGVVTQSNQAADYTGRTVVFEGGEGWGGKLRAVDFSDPAAAAAARGVDGPAPVAADAPPGTGGDQALRGALPGQAAILDVSDPMAPAQVGYFNTWRPFDVGRGLSSFDSAMSVRVPGDGNIYVAESARGLIISGRQDPREGALLDVRGATNLRGMEPPGVRSHTSVISLEEWASLPEDVPGEFVDGALSEEELPSYVHEFVIAWLLRALLGWVLPRGGFAGRSRRSSRSRRAVGASRTSRCTSLAAGHPRRHG